MGKLHIKKIELSRKSRILIGILIFLLVVTGIVLFLYFTWNSMFNGNDRFRLLHINITSAEGSGWWHGREDEVIRILGQNRKAMPECALVKGQTNLFDLKLGVIRKKLEEQPEIESASVTAVLPDTLNISLTERVPSATLRNIPPKRYLSKDNMILDGSRSICLPGLPILYKFKSPIPLPGGRFVNQQDNANCAAANEFIRLCSTLYQDIRILTVDVSRSDALIMRVLYRNDPRYNFVVLVPPEKPQDGLDRIVTSIRDALRRGAPSRTLDLRFKNQTVGVAPAVPPVQDKGQKNNSPRKKK